MYKKHQYLNNIISDSQKSWWSMFKTACTVHVLYKVYAMLSIHALYHLISNVHKFNTDSNSHVTLTWPSKGLNCTMCIRMYNSHVSISTWNTCTTTFENDCLVWEICKEHLLVPNLHECILVYNRPVIPNLWNARITNFNWHLAWLQKAL